MDTHFEFVALLFLSRYTYKYQQSSFRAVRFDTRLTNSELEGLFNEIYLKTNNFLYLQKYLSRKKESNTVFCMIIISMTCLMIAAFSNFEPLFFIIFVLSALATALVIVCGMYLDCYYLDKTKDYEKIVIDILYIWNEKFREKGIKFSIIRSFYVLMIHGDYKKPNFKYNLCYGKRVYDQNGKIIRYEDKKIPQIGNDQTQGQQVQAGVPTQNLENGNNNQGLLRSTRQENNANGGNIELTAQNQPGATTVVTGTDFSSLEFISVESKKIKI